MSVLRAMTWNLGPVGKETVPEDPMVERVLLAADTLNALPPDEAPHVIVFNGVFNENARKRLLARLRSRWPAHVSRFGGSGSRDDSGLMLFSRYSLRPLQAPVGFDGEVIKGAAAFHTFEACDGKDRRRAKGVGLVKLDTPIGGVPVVFTNLQQDDAAEGEFGAVREAQLGEVRGFIDALLGTGGGDRQWLVLLGDLNLRGDKDGTRDEWRSQFGGGSGALAECADDGWHGYMRPPGRDEPADQGITFRQAGGPSRRMDYIAVEHGFNSPRKLVPQYMRTRVLGPGAHASLEAHLHPRRPHCSPVDAQVSPDIAPGQYQDFVVELADADSMSWIHIPVGGNYLAIAPHGVRCLMFEEDDLSNPVQVERLINAKDVNNPGLSRGLEDPRMNPVGPLFKVNGPCFLRFDAAPGVALPYSGRFFAYLYHITGTTKAEALPLSPWDEASVPFLLNQPHGAFDECWFRMPMPVAWSQRAYQTLVELKLPKGAQATARVEDASGQVLGATAGPPGGPVAFTAAGGFDIYVVVRRPSLDQVGQWIEVKPALAWLHPVRLVCEDETGADWAGSDEITLSLAVDGLSPPYFQVFWDGADTGESFALPEQRVQPVAFVDSVEVTVAEGGDLIAPADGANNAAIFLPVGGTTERQSVSITVKDLGPDGRYRFDYVMSRRRLPGIL